MYAKIISMKALTTAVTPELHAQLRKISDDTGIKMKAIFRQALEAWIKAHKAVRAKA